jgi:hypothetical protein
VRLLLAAALAALAATASAQAAPAACGLGAAKAAIRSTNLKMNLLGGGATKVDPGSADKVICFDLTRDGKADMAVTIASGGTAGDVGFAVFRATPAGWVVALKSEGYKVGLWRVGGDLVSSQPIYKKNDPNCCPTGGFDHSRYHWNGRKFVIARNYHTSSYKP